MKNKKRALCAQMANAPHLCVNAFRHIQQRLEEDCSLKQAMSSLFLRPSTRNYLKAIDEYETEKIERWMEHAEHHLLLYDDADYPPLLREIPSPPLVLYIRGKKDVLSTSQIAVVGSRKPTHAGRENAFLFAQFLAEQGLTVTSGLALGIDGHAHFAAVEHSAATVAVLGTGLGMIYPRDHHHLAEKIINHGALVSEFALEEGPLAKNFPRRNRIISGLSLGVLVIEAAERSGSLSTARHALLQNREVFAIPGSIHNPFAKGCHALIQQGAKLVTGGEDILSELQLPCKKVVKPNQLRQNAPPNAPLANIYRKLVECIGYETVSVETITNRLGENLRNVVPMLVELEIAGWVTADEMGYRVKNVL